MAKESANDRFRRGAAEVGIDPEIQRFPEDTRTAQEAANALGCELGQIVKSLIFAIDDEPVLVLTSGSNQVSTERVGALLGGSLSRADAGVVREATGFAIGGVPPFGHLQPLRTLIDRDLLGYELVWGAAGTPDTVFPITPPDLVAATGADVVDVAVLD